MSPYLLIRIATHLWYWTEIELDLSFQSTFYCQVFPNHASLTHTQRLKLCSFFIVSSGLLIFCFQFNWNVEIGKCCKKKDILYTSVKENVGNLKHLILEYVCSHFKFLTFKLLHRLSFLVRTTFIAPEFLFNFFGKLIDLMFLSA